MNCVFFFTQISKNYKAVEGQKHFKAIFGEKIGAIRAEMEEMRVMNENLRSFVISEVCKLLFFSKMNDKFTLLFYLQKLQILGEMKEVAQTTNNIAHAALETFSADNIQKLLYDDGESSGEEEEEQEQESSFFLFFRNYQEFFAKFNKNK